MHTVVLPWCLDLTTGSFYLAKTTAAPQGDTLKRADRRQQAFNFVTEFQAASHNT